MNYSLDVDPTAEQQIAALPHTALLTLAEALTMLELLPWNGEPINRANPDGPVRQLPFAALGLITYLIMEDEKRVDILLVTWAGLPPTPGSSPRQAERPMTRRARHSSSASCRCRSSSPASATVSDQRPDSSRTNTVARQGSKT